jgi:hypothetical protein
VPLMTGQKIVLFDPRGASVESLPQIDGAIFVPFLPLPESSGVELRDQLAMNAPAWVDSVCGPVNDWMANANATAPAELREGRADEIRLHRKVLGPRPGNAV